MLLHLVAFPSVLHINLPTVLGTWSFAKFLRHIAPALNAETVVDTRSIGSQYQPPRCKSRPMKGTKNYNVRIASVYIWLAGEAQITAMGRLPAARRRWRQAQATGRRQIGGLKCCDRGSTTSGSTTKKAPQSGAFRMRPHALAAVCGTCSVRRRFDTQGRLVGLCDRGNLGWCKSGMEVM